MPRSFIVLAALRVAAAGYSAWSAVPVQHPVLPLAWNTLEETAITANPQRDEITLDLPTVDLPAGTMVDQPASVGEFPVNAAIYSFHAEVLDDQGRRLSNELLHHMNVMNPAERELFLPISRRILASGRETGEVHFPWLLFGAPVHAGERVLANAMLHNSSNVDYRRVHVRLVLKYVPERRPWPVFSVLPWQLDVAFPVGDKSFDLPPGRSERSYEGSPAVPGKLVVIGGHMHDYGETIELWDATAGTMLWHGEPEATAPGQPKSVPLTKFWGLRGLGLPITPDHRYRVRVVYNNPTGHTIPGGGMGVVGGLFMPDRKAVWPAANPQDSLYVQDLRHFMGPVGSSASTTPMSHMHMEGAAGH